MLCPCGASMVGEDTDPASYRESLCLDGAPVAIFEDAMLLVGIDNDQVTAIEPASTITQFFSA